MAPTENSSVPTAYTDSLSRSHESNFEGDKFRPGQGAGVEAPVGTHWRGGGVAASNRDAAEEVAGAGRNSSGVSEVHLAVILRSAAVSRAGWALFRVASNRQLEC